MSNVYKEQIDFITAILGQIQTKGKDGGDNAAILTMDLARNYYVQFAADHDTRPDGHDVPTLYAEAVGNEALEEKDRLSESQRAKLLALGWQPPHSSPNHFRSWRATTDEERRTIAEVVLETMEEVYGFDFEEEIRINLLIA
jgi:hypothetical protein